VDKCSGGSVDNLLITCGYSVEYYIVITNPCPYPRLVKCWEGGRTGDSYFPYFCMSKIILHILKIILDK